MPEARAGTLGRDAVKYAEGDSASMRWPPAAPISILVAAALAGCVEETPLVVDPPLPPLPEPTGPFAAVSPAFADGQPIPREHTCEADNKSPPLRFANVPTKARTVAMTVIDEDVPHPNVAVRTVIHWTFWNLPGEVGELSAGADMNALGAREGDNGGGQTGYRGPCPPAGTHRYFFTAYAIDGALDLPSGSTLAQLEEALKGRVVAENKFHGTYARLIPS